MKNVTITLKEATARWARVEAAKADKSLSRWIGEKLESEMEAKATIPGAINGIGRFVPDADQMLQSRDERFDRGSLRRKTDPS